MKLNLATLRKRVSDETDAYKLLEELRWHGTPICAHCGHDKAYFLNPANGVSRGTGAKDENGQRKQSVRRVWKCAKCRKQFSVLTNTIFHRTKVPLSTWLTVMVQMASAKNGISAREIERMHDVTPETAWFILHRLREAMKREPVAGLLRGTVAADETWIGGVEGNRKKSQRNKSQITTTAEPERIEPGKRQKRPGNLRNQKTIVLSLIATDTGEARSVVVPDVTGATLRKAIAEQVDMSATVLHTDESNSYRLVAPELAGHETVNHAADEYVRYDDGRVITSNQAEGYFSQLKRSIDGTHHHVSREHLPRYLAEFDFRYTTRKLDDSARLTRMIDQADGRRLTYRPLTGR